MTLQEIKDLDLYKCSLQDINKADKALARRLDSLISKGHATGNNFKGTATYWESKKLHTLVSRAKKGMDSDGYMIGRNINLNRVPNSQSVL